ncbi:BTB/POZ domain-containing protein [Apostasia shenzhenica]|uniref:BTB/POZ domain-containing protein n=1 Tax=Apostasia shenzhenica TaxID=1088818 RepID=A0A2I0AMK8_9ASPA|nr:BTB/POZ domain-containing protein [Apostasia shenzhenica]
MTFEIGDRATSDVVVRLRTNEGRDHRFYCHSKVLIEKSKYFADRLSDDWPTCQIIDSCSCVEVHCQELDFNFHVTVLRLFYVQEPHAWNGVRNALGVLQVAINLGCQQMATACMEYLEAVPWEEAEEEEILRTIPSLGSAYESILSRLQPVDQALLIGVFVPSLRFATSSPPISMQELKSSVQEQLDYMLTDDDDAPLFSLDNELIRSAIKDCVNNLLCRFDSLLQSMLNFSIDSYMKCKTHDFFSHLCDISWACQILSKMEIMKILVNYWVEKTAEIVKAAENVKPIAAENLPIESKIVEVASKVLESIGFANAIVTTPGRIKMVKIWLPFIQKARDSIERHSVNTDEVSLAKLDSEVWQGIESALVSILLTLPSIEQAEILSDWLKSKFVGYPDLSEAFDVWCYRTKVARRRLASLAGPSN